ncbi:FecR domain-containing protein [Chitinophaga pollutisoli]|uniref:FecR domain-containing protein n=1 Tax=Chitinophaga pollutisoli TaxID=3133966 RepID=A0ABZ2YRX1_9BACT
MSLAEAAELDAWMAAAVPHRNFADELEEGALFTELFAASQQHIEAAILDKVINRIREEEGFVSLLQQVEEEDGEAPQEARDEVPRLRLLRHWRMAAAVLLLIAAGTYLWYAGNTRKGMDVAEVKETIVMPGRNGAILTLSDGSQLVLDSLDNGVVARQQGANVVMNAGSIAYNHVGTGAGNVAFNTMTTPKGRQFHVTLPDGTGVWLNAASSLRYPTAFTGKERVVALTGEAYFEVAANAEMPFRVTINQNAAVEVLGTHFNVQAYGNEDSIETTLLEGAVRVVAGPAADKGNALRLKPGQQAKISRTASQEIGPIRLVKEADLDKVMAWKNGTFNFEGQTLEAVMRQLERWYDIKVVFEGKGRDMKFFGKMDRNITLNELLSILSNNGLQYKLEGGKTLIIQ